jgi:hypothetical protein
MKNLILISSLFLFTSGYETISAQRNVVWLHATTKDNTAWQLYNQLFAGTYSNLNNVNPSYASTDGIAAASTDVKNKVDNALGSQNTNQFNIGVGSDLGSLVIRDLDTQLGAGQKRFGGMILAGSPNKGIALLEAWDNGQLTEYIDGAEFALEDLMFEGQLVTDLPLNFVQGTYGNATGTDLRPNSNALSLIQDIPDVDPNVIVLWGNEEENSHWRILNSYVIPPETLPLSAGPTGAENDDGLPDMIDDLSQDIQNEIKSAKIGVVFGIVKVVIGSLTGNPPSIVLGAIKIVGNAFDWAHYDKRGRWIDDSQTLWNEMIDANSIYQQQVWVDIFICNDLLIDLLDDNIDDLSAPGVMDTWLELLNDPNCYEQVLANKNFYSLGQNDGLLSKGAMQLTPMFVLSLDIQRANHLEIVNHYNSMARFDAIYRGVGIPWFKITP